MLGGDKGGCGIPGKFIAANHPAMSTGKNIPPTGDNSNMCLTPLHNRTNTIIFGMTGFYNC